MRLLLASLCLPSVLAAQKIPVPGAPDRIAQLLDLRPLRQDQPRGAPFRPLLLAAKPRGEGESSPKQVNERLARVLAHFLEPPLGPGDDVTALGEDWLVVLGSPAQAASAERLLRAAVATADPIEVQVRLFRVPRDKFAAKVQPSLVASQRGDRVTYEAVVDKEGAGKLLQTITAAARECIDAPQAAALPLRRVVVAVKNQTSYVKDFTLTRAGDRWIADPVIDVVWDGTETDLVATILPDGMLGVSCDVVVQELQRPIAEFQTTLAQGTLPVKIQLPRVTGTRLSQTAVLGEGSMVVLGAQCVDGDFLLAVVQAHASPR